MKPTVTLKMQLMTFAVLLLATACVSRDLDLNIKDAPRWVNNGSTYANKQGERLFCGVGSSPPMGDAALQSAVADNRSRSEVTRILSPYLDALTENYLAAASSGGRAVDEEAATRQFKRLGRDARAEEKVIAHWRDKRTGILYSLAQLDLNAVKATADSDQEIDEVVQRYIQGHADGIFDRVSKLARLNTGGG